MDQPHLSLPAGMFQATGVDLPTPPSGVWMVWVSSILPKFSEIVSVVSSLPPLPPVEYDEISTLPSLILRYGTFGLPAPADFWQTSSASLCAVPPHTDLTRFGVEQSTSLVKVRSWTLTLPAVDPWMLWVEPDWVAPQL